MQKSCIYAVEHKIDGKASIDKILYGKTSGNFSIRVEAKEIIEMLRTCGVKEEDIKKLEIWKINASKTMEETNDRA